MFFSIIIPTHNDSKYLGKLLDSIARQTFTDYNVIVVADACTYEELDFTYDIVKSYEDKMTITMQVVNYGNAGMARNAGLDIATGQFILFADDDDYYLHDWVFEEIFTLVSKTQADVTLFGFIFGALGYKTPFDNNGGTFGNVWSKCWKRAAIGETRFPNVYPDDDLQFCRLMDKKEDLNYVSFNTPIYYYNYLREGSINWIEQTQKS